MLEFARIIRLEEYVSQLKYRKMLEWKCMESNGIQHLKMGNSG